MKNSLGLRLLLAAAVSTVVALLATALVLNQLFRTYFEERIHSELESHLVLLASSVELAADGQIVVAELPDPRFSEPLSGYYWQVQSEGLPTVLSQSYWFEELVPDRSSQRGVIEFSSHVLPDGLAFTIGTWLITRVLDGEDVELQLLVALEKAQWEGSISGFAQNLAISMAVLGVFLILASLLQVRIGLKPLDKLRSQVAAVKENPENRLSRDHPAELEPLVTEVNALLDHQAETIEASRARASTLAHGLKTPLTVMRALSQELRRAQQPLVPAEIDDQVDAMQHLVERELARTRDQQATREVWCAIAPTAEKVIQSFRRRAGCAHIHWQADIPETAIGPFDEFALIELLGNLVDNAAKWTRDQISITAAGQKEGGYVAVTDNGPGVSDENLTIIIARGKRLDPSKPGQGLGLAIVNDMVAQRGAVFRLRNLETGGLLACVSWGAAESPPT